MPLTDAKRERRCRQRRRAGRIMLQRIDELLAQKVDFAIETTPATRSYIQLVRRAQALGYKWNSYIRTRIMEQFNTKDMSGKELKAKMSVGLKQSYKKVVEQHRHDNQPLIFSENGEVKYVDPFTVAL